MRLKREKCRLMHENLDSKIDALRRDYVVVLRDVMQQVEALAAEIQFGLDEERTYRELREIAHRQAGTALTLQFVPLGAAASAVDIALQSGLREAQLKSLLEAWVRALSAVAGPALP
jgi:HPt (histidine-containing phosphotransfer) domain-containing protein